MTNAELDTMWFQAQHDAIKAGEDFTRYRFAAIIAAAEREACAKLCETYETASIRHEAPSTAMIFNHCAKAIRARGNK